MYPILLKSIYKKMVWGSESWDVTCRPLEMSVVENGFLCGEVLSDLIARNPSEWVGSRVCLLKEFPLLIKMIEANDRLSVQVHPGDIYANSHENGASGKTEMWYVMDAPKDGYLIVGLKEGVTKDTLHAAFENNTVEDCLNRLPVKPGDIVYIPAGLVHAITNGVKVAEVQQNSDITYRLYDYGRLGLDGKPRELHLDKSLDVTDFSQQIRCRAVPGLVVDKGECQIMYAIANPYFAILRYALNGIYNETSDPAAFSVLTCVEGAFKIVTPEQVVEVPCGRSVFIPAAMGAYTLESQANCVFLKSFVPDVVNDFIAPLQAAGFSEKEISKNTECTIHI